MKTKLLAIGAFLLCANLSQAQVSTANLMVHYKLDGNGTDASGNDQNATSFNTSGATDRFGKVGGATYFNGVDGYMLVPASSSVQPTDSISICVWINQELKSNIGWSTIIDKRYAYLSDPWSSYGMGTHPDYGNKWMFSVSSGTTGSGRTAAAKASNPYNTWTFIVGTYNRNQVKLYINGVLDSAISKTGPLGYSSLGMYLGYSGTGPNEYYKGRMDDLRVYSRVLSATEIQALYSAPNAVSEISAQAPAFAIYPNPATDKMRIDTELSWETAAIYDVLGKKVWTGKFETELNLDRIEAGHYVLTLTNENGSVYSKKFVKQ
jgi:hypothetical protein